MRPSEAATAGRRVDGVDPTVPLHDAGPAGHAIVQPTVRPTARPSELIPWLVTASSGGDAPGELDRVAVDRVEDVGGGTVRMSGLGSIFEAVATWTPLVGTAAPGWEVDLEVRVKADVGTPIDASLAVAIRVPASDDPSWLIPGLFYGENRPAASRARYPRWVPAPTADAGGDPLVADPFVADAWWFRSDRAATPAIFATGGGRRVALATTELSAAGPTGMGFGTVPTETGDQREIRLSFPYREAPVVYDGSATALPADRPVHRFEPGTPVRLSYLAFVVPAGPDDSTAILRTLHGRLMTDAPLRPWVGPDEAATLAAEGLLTWHDWPTDGVLIETAAFDRRGDGTAREPGDRPAMHVAWLSGAPAAYALLRHGRRVGRADAMRSGTRVLDEIATHLAPCGTFWGQWTEADGWGKGWTPGPDALHARTIAEATLFMTRAAVLDRHPEWLAAIRSNVDFILGVESDGSIPRGWNGSSGEPLAWNGTAGLAWAAALVEASVALDRPNLLDAARRIGERYAPEVRAGTLGGAPEDVDLGPTSEDGYVAITSYVALARAARARSADGEAARWTELARIAADWTLSFRFTYDVAFPPGTPLADLRFGTRGADLASPANQHLHSYGLVCSEELLELAALTGDDHYRLRAQETYACFRQCIARHDGDFGARRGMAPERFYQTRYDGAKGEIGRLSHAWCLGLLLHASEIAVARPELVAP